MLAPAVDSSRYSMARAFYCSVVLAMMRASYPAHKAVDRSRILAVRYQRRDSCLNCNWDCDHYATVVVDSHSDDHDDRIDMKYRLIYDCAGCRYRRTLLQEYRTQDLFALADYDLRALNDGPARNHCRPGTFVAHDRSFGLGVPRLLPRESSDLCDSKIDPDSQTYEGMNPLSVLSETTISWVIVGVPSDQTISSSWIDGEVHHHR